MGANIGYTRDWDRSDPNHIESSAALLWKLYSSSRDGDRRSREILWRLYDSRTKPTDDGQTYTQRRVLWKFYNDVTVGDARSIDAFPFITWDKRPDFKKFSFAWKLLSYERDGKDRSASFLFIPLKWKAK